ncbi:M91 family zinc metallopeptidase [Coralloluteibacterium thermophilus]|uniref:M91 family zinc metallopeptidase n=1 Tax=Coralloluteibacterium thermophilum TaxID=2707049 RepID=A0ABV9NI02_9GAMM
MSLQLDVRTPLADAATAQARANDLQGYWAGPTLQEAPPGLLSEPQSSRLVSAEYALTDVAQRSRLAAVPVTVDGNGSNAAERTQTETPDGKPVVTDVLHRGSEVVVQREQTLTEYGGRYYLASDQLTLVTGDDADSIQVSQGANGALAVDVNGQRIDLRLAQGQELQIRAGGGDDVIVVAPDVGVNTVVRAESGDNTIATGGGSDRIFTGSGNDTIDAGAGDNYVVSHGGSNTIVAGDGNNVIYGGSGSDEVRVGNGRNYIDGGDGDDLIYTGAGDNMVHTGAGDDLVYSGTGNDRIYTGGGSDRIEVEGGRGNVVYALGGADAHAIATGSGAAVETVDVADRPALGSRGVSVEGSPEFVQRVQADLAMLASSPAGQQMLAALDAAADASGNTVAIRELANEQNGYAISSGGRIVNGRPSAGSDVEVRYNPDFFMAQEFPAPVVVLYHELSHAFNGVTGTFFPGTYNGSDRVDAGSVPNAERQAVGVESDFVYDFGDGSGPIAHNPFPLTENGLRTELGLPLRLHYTL